MASDQTSNLFVNVDRGTSQEIVRHIQYVMMVARCRWRRRAEGFPVAYIDRVGANDAEQRSFQIRDGHDLLHVLAP
jgi:hypothetical protein